MKAAADAGLDMIGLTDHDTVEGWDEAAQAVESTGVALLRGVEMSCSASGVTVHLLGYLIDPTNVDILAAFERTLDSRKTRARRMVERLSADFPITWEDVLAFGPVDGGPIGRPHIADALVARGIFPNRNVAFEKALHPSLPYFVHHWAPDPLEATKLIRAAGGVPVLAHPRAMKRQRYVVSEETIAAMTQVGLFGIERDHRDQSAHDRAAVDRIAKRLGLFEMGSSDYHGSGKPNRLGENTTDPAIVARIAEQGKLEVLRP